MILKNKKGFSSLLLIVLGGIFITITITVGVQISSSETQDIDTATSISSETRLNFIGQTIQADFYNNLLQNSFESAVVDVLGSKKHVVDPQSSFYNTIGPELENALAQSMGSLIFGGAGDVYSEAYSSVPGVSCTPSQVSGGSNFVTFDSSSTDALVIDTMTLGQRIACEDSETETSNEIALQARDYTLSIRAPALYNKAVEAILAAKGVLSFAQGSALYGSTWRSPEDPSVASDILSGAMGWKTAANAISLIGLEGTDGIELEAGSLHAYNSNGGDWTVADIDYTCKEGLAAHPTGPQTCRPEGVSMSIVDEESEETCKEGDSCIKLNFKKDDTQSSDVSFSIGINGIEVSLPLPDAIGKLIINVIEKASPTTLTGEVTYSGAALLCNAFEGKASAATISGSVYDSNDKYIPAGDGVVKFDFISTAQDIGAIKDNKEDCGSEAAQKIIKENLIAMMTSDGSIPININIVQNKTTGEAEADKASLQKIADNMGSHALAKVPTEKKEYSVSVTYRGKEITVSPKKDAGDTSTKGKESKVDGTAEGLKAELNEKSTTTRTVTQAYTDTIQSLQNTASELTNAGDAETAQNVRKVSTAICKAIGVQNYISTGDYAKALLALCGIGKTSELGDVDNICKLAGIYQAIDSGNPRLVAAYLTGLLSGTNFRGTAILAGQIEAALSTGDAKSVLAAAGSALSLSGDLNAGSYLSSLGAIVSGIESGNALTAASGALSLMAGTGANGLARFYSSINGITAAIKGNNPNALMSSIEAGLGALGAKLPSSSSGLGNIGASLGNIAANIGDLSLECDGAPWGLLCTAPPVAGGICPSTHEAMPNCAFAYGTPAFDMDSICGDIFDDFNFDVKCGCMFTCTGPSGEYPYYEERSLGVSIAQIRMLLDEDFLAGKLSGVSAELMSFCSLDP